MTYVLYFIILMDNHFFFKIMITKFVINWNLICGVQTLMGVWQNLLLVT